MSKTTLHNSKASLKVRELKDEELNGVVGGTVRDLAMGLPSGKRPTYP